MRRKMALFCNVPVEAVIPARDVSSIYQVPLALHEQGLDRFVVDHLELKTDEPDLSVWRRMVGRIYHATSHVNIAIWASPWTSATPTSRSRRRAFTGAWRATWRPGSR